MSRINYKPMYEALKLENEQLRRWNAEWAQDSARLKREVLKLKDQSSANYGVREEYEHA